MSVVKALQAALAREHAAIYGYGVAGAHLDDTERDAVTRDLAEHKAARDRLERRIREHDATPVTAKPAYALPFTVTGGASATKLLVRIESGVAGAYLGLVSAATDDLRRDAAREVRDCAIRQAAWGGTIGALPGLRR
ncbi:MAG: ferritin-like domain-containing protein [Streptosporangiales bacterium]